MDTKYITPIEVYYCSHDEDAVWQKRLETHLSALERQGLICGWHKNQIPGGAKIESQINDHLSAAHIILLLISPDFMASDYCYAFMLKALARDAAGETRVVPINLRPVVLEGTPISEFQMYPRGELPITQWTDYDEAFRHVARGIREVVRNLIDGELRNNTVSGVRDTHRSSGTPDERHFGVVPYYTINTTEAISIFHKFMQPNEQMKVLCLSGQGNMGKTHLLTKVFPPLVRQTYHARCVLLDLRNKAHTIPDILQIASSQFDGPFLEGYLAEQERWIRDHKVVGDAKEDIQMRDFLLTSHFVKQLRTLDDMPLFFFIDTINEAKKKTQTWLMDLLLTQLHSFSHVRTILAGRALPEAHSSYSASCRTYQLRPVLEEQAYIDYCKSLQATLIEQSICDFAYACDYAPGTFISLLPKFRPRR